MDDDKRVPLKYIIITLYFLNTLQSTDSESWKNQESDFYVAIKEMRQ